MFELIGKPSTGALIRPGAVILITSSPTPASQPRYAASSLAALIASPDEHSVSSAPATASTSITFGADAAGADADPALHHHPNPVS